MRDPSDPIALARLIDERTIRLTLWAWHRWPPSFPASHCPSAAEGCSCWWAPVDLAWGRASATAIPCARSWLPSGLSGQKMSNSSFSSRNSYSDEMHIRDNVVTASQRSGIKLKRKQETRISSSSAKEKARIEGRLIVFSAEIDKVDKESFGSFITTRD